MSTTKRTTVVTYQHAYTGGASVLCAEHAESPPAYLPALGPVSHGARSGTCDVCTAQTLPQALRDGGIIAALGGFVSRPAGGWSETRQAREQIADACPHRHRRAYSISELIAAALMLDGAERYQWREGVARAA